MIYSTRIITINKGSSSLDEQIVLYKGDKNVEIQFVLKNNPFKQKNGTVSAYATYGQLIINRDADPIISEVSQMSNNRVIFIITGDMIDGIEEMGDYDFQIRLFNEDQTSRVTLPPIENGIRIEEPLCEEATVSSTYVNSRRSVIMASNDSGEVFDEEGNYNRTNWYNGDIITDTKLNKIEEALYLINDDIPTNYATEMYVEDIDRNTRNYVADNYTTKAYVDHAIDNINVDFAGYATEEYVDDAVRNIPGADLTGYATEDYVNTMIGDIEDLLGGI